MTPENDAPVVDAAEVAPDASVEAVTAQPAVATAAEALEKEPQLDLTVERGCKNPDGRYVGLNAAQRGVLRVEVGSSVELFDCGKSLGLFTVGAGAKELQGTDRFTVNGVDPGTPVVVKKASEKREILMELDVRHGIENVPTDMQEDESKAYSDRTTRRMGIISKRFPGLDSDEFMTVPTAILNQLAVDRADAGQTSKPTIASISRAKVRMGDNETEVVMVPAGNDIGFTTKASQKLRIPSVLTKIRFRIDNGVFVID